MNTKDMILADAIEVYIEAEKKLRKRKRIISCLIASNVAMLFALVLTLAR